MGTIHYMQVYLQSIINIIAHNTLLSPVVIRLKENKRCRWAIGLWYVYFHTEYYLLETKGQSKYLKSWR